MSSEANGSDVRLYIFVPHAVLGAGNTVSGGTDGVPAPPLPRMVLSPEFKYPTNVIAWLGFLNSDGNSGVRVWLGSGWGSSSGRSPGDSTQSATPALPERDGGRAAPGAPAVCAGTYLFMSFTNSSHPLSLPAGADRCFQTGSHHRSLQTLRIHSCSQRPLGTERP